MPSTVIDRKTFLSNLLKSGLLTADELRALKPRLPNSDRGRVVARALVDQGVLTRFQAELLLGGRTRGFLLGQYKVLDHLGQGGMGRVFKAVHQAMNRTVAIKVLSSRLLKTEKARNLFRREVQAAARLHHPNIVTAYDANQVGERPFLVMEYVDGPNLQQLVCSKGPLPVGLACDLIRQVAVGLQYASDMGMVHRDIKPANILVQRVGDSRRGPRVAKLVDFGLALLQEGQPEQGDEDAGSRRGPVLGTPDFLSPEQARAEGPVDVCSDLYSLGCTFYYILTGQVPFPGGTALEKINRHAAEEPVPVEELRPEVPAEVAGILRKLMAKNPDRRFQTPAEVAAALEPFAAPGSGSWDAVRAAEPSPEEGSGTPDSLFADLKSLPSVDSSSSEVALAGTVGPEGTATPASGHEVIPAPRAERQSVRRRGVLRAIRDLAATLVERGGWLLRVVGSYVARRNA